MKATLLTCLGLSPATLLSICFFPTVSLAQTDVWLGGNGNWSDGTKWSAGVPTATSDVFIDNGNAKSSVVTVDIANAACHTLTIDSDDNLGIQPSMTLTVNGTSIANSGTFEINGVLSVAGNNLTLSGSGPVILTGGTISGGPGSMLTNASAIQGSGHINVPVFNQGLQSVVNANQSNATLFVNGIANQGLMDATGGATLQLYGNIDNLGGTIAANGGTIFNGAGIHNGTVEGDGGSVITNNFLMQSSNGAVLTLSGLINNNGKVQSLGGSTVLVKGTITNNKIFDVACGSLFKITGTLTNFSGTTLKGGRYFVCGVLQLNGADIVTNAANIQLTGPNAAILDLSNNDGLRNLASTARGGELEMKKGKNVTTSGSYTSAGKLFVRDGSSFTVNGGLTATQSSTIVQGTVSATSGMSIQSGSVTGDGTIISAVNSSGKITPNGSPGCPVGKLSMSAYTQNKNGSLTIFISGVSYGQLGIANGASLNGVLNIELICQFVPAIGDTFAIVTANTVTGQFPTVNGLSINGNEHFEIAYNPTNVTLTVVSGP